MLKKIVSEGTIEDLIMVRGLLEDIRDMSREIIDNDHKGEYPNETEARIRKEKREANNDEQNNDEIHWGDDGWGERE